MTGQNKELYLLFRKEGKSILPVNGDNSTEAHRHFAESVSLEHPLCVRTAMSYPGLFSVENPRSACRNCALKEECGSFCVQTLGVNDGRHKNEFVVMHLQAQREKSPDKEKEILLHVVHENRGKLCV